MNNFYQSLLNQRDPQAEALQTELMNQYKQSLAQREQSIAEAKQRAMELEGESGIQDINIRPLAAAVDAWTGSNLANSMPVNGPSKEIQMEKLRQAVGQQEAGLIDDRLNVARLMIEDNRAKENNAFKANQAAADAELRRALLNTKLGAQAELADKKNAAKTAGGADKNEQNILKTKESQKVQALINFKNALGDYERLVKQKGINLTGKDKDLLNSTYADLKIKYKEGANLGALTGPDVGIIVDAIAPATGFSGAARLAAAKMGFGGGVEGLVSGIEQIKRNADSDFKTTQSTLESAFGPSSGVLRNYRNSFYGGSPQQAGAPSGGEVRVMFNGQMMSIPREDLESAIRDGAEVVK